MKLNDHANVSEIQPVNMEEDTLPLVDHNVLEWEYEDSEVEPLIVVKSVSKSRSSKKKRKTRATRNPPSEDPVNSEGEKSKVCRRFNLRETETSLKK